MLLAVFQLQCIPSKLQEQGNRKNEAGSKEHRFSLYSILHKQQNRWKRTMGWMPKISAHFAWCSPQPSEKLKLVRKSLSLSFSTLQHTTKYVIVNNRFLSACAMVLRYQQFQPTSIRLSALNAPREIFLSKTFMSSQLEKQRKARNKLPSAEYGIPLTRNTTAERLCYMRSICAFYVNNDYVVDRTKQGGGIDATYFSGSHERTCLMWSLTVCINTREMRINISIESMAVLCRRDDPGGPNAHMVLGATCEKVRLLFILYVHQRIKRKLLFSLLLRFMCFQYFSFHREIQHSSTRRIKTSITEEKKHQMFVISWSNMVWFSSCTNVLDEPRCNKKSWTVFFAFKLSTRFSFSKKKSVNLSLKPCTDGTQL